jgi:AcrR family transcriptional regulator
MAQAPENLRVRRTQKLLREALIELIEERGFDELTVGEITERAMVSRAAFYRNYRDKYDLVEQIFAEAMQALFSTLSEMGHEHPPQVWVKFLDHIAQYDRLYRALLGQKGSRWFVQKMRASMLELVKQITHMLPAGIPEMTPPTADFVTGLVASMFVEAITWWLEQGRPYSSQEMTRRCADLAFAIFQQASSW